MIKEYFVWHWDEGFATYATAEEAQREAQKLFDVDVDVGQSEGFIDECFGVCWGKIRQKSVLKETGEQVEWEGEMANCVEPCWEPPTDAQGDER